MVVRNQGTLVTPLPPKLLHLAAEDCEEWQGSIPWAGASEENGACTACSPDASPLCSEVAVLVPLKAHPEELRPRPGLSRVAAKERLAWRNCLHGALGMNWRTEVSRQGRERDWHQLEGNLQKWAQLRCGTWRTENRHWPSLRLPLSITEPCLITLHVMGSPLHHSHASSPCTNLGGRNRECSTPAELWFTGSGSAAELGPRKGQQVTVECLREIPDR